MAFTVRRERYDDAKIITSSITLASQLKRFWSVESLICALVDSFRGGKAIQGCTQEPSGISDRFAKVLWSEDYRRHFIYRV